MGSTGSVGGEDNMRLAPVRADSLGQQVFERIRDAIFSGSIQPGDALRELQLAKEMGVSQSTVRNALGQLENVGLVVRQQNRGTTVTELSAADIRDRLKVRVALEELAFIEASRRATPGDLAELGQLAHAIRAAIAQNYHFEKSQADRIFHRRVWSIAGNPVLERTLDAITLPMFAFFSVLQKSEMVSPAGTQPHEELVAAIATLDPRTARLAIRKHILKSYPSMTIPNTNA